MTPTVPEILRGNFSVLAGQVASGASGASGDFGDAQTMTVALLTLLCAQEVEQADAAVDAENHAIAAVLSGAGRQPTGRQVDRTTLNADLRRELAAFHADVELAGDTATDRTILRLYRDMAEGRRLALPVLS